MADDKRKTCDACGREPDRFDAVTFSAQNAGEPELTVLGYLCLSCWARGNVWAAKQALAEMRCLGRSDGDSETKSLMWADGDRREK